VFSNRLAVMLFVFSFSCYFMSSFLRSFVPSWLLGLLACALLPPFLRPFLRFFVLILTSPLFTAESVKKLFQLLRGQRICGLVGTSKRG